MKCIYCLAPDLDEICGVCDRLREAGIDDRHMHVASNSKDKLEEKRLRSCNYLESLDIVRSGIIGAAVGLISGFAMAVLLLAFEALGPAVPPYAYFILTGVTTLFGAWVGGLTGVARENRKLAEFHDDIEANKHLMMIYVQSTQETRIRKAIAGNHPRIDLAAVDDHFLNPFSAVRYAGLPQSVRTNQNNKVMNHTMPSADV